VSKAFFLRQITVLASTIIATALSIAGWAGPCRAQLQQITIATLEWPPYVGADLPQQGATAAVVKAAFVAAGYEPTLSFVPWKRAIDEATRSGATVQAFFPGYHCKQRSDLVSSKSIGNGPLGFAELTTAPLSWNNLDDLQTKTIGVVQGYANTEEFDARVKDGRIKADASDSDLTNLRKLAAGRLDGAVIDRYVLEYLRKTEASLKANADKLRFAAKPLEDKQLFVCAHDDAAGRKLITEFDAGLAKIDIPAMIGSYFAGL